MEGVDVGDVRELVQDRRQLVMEGLLRELDLNPPPKKRDASRRKGGGGIRRLIESKAP